MTVELGGQFLGPGQDHAYDLVAELGLSVLPTHGAGDHLIDTGASRPRRYRGTIPRLNPLVLLDVARAQRRFETLARTVDPDQPWRTPHASHLDCQTLATWIQRTLRTAGGRRLFTMACEAAWSCQPERQDLAGPAGRGRGPATAGRSDQLRPASAC